ncbi:MAG: helix-turn-helix domain-containing protein [Acidihalobacter sp.]
MREHRGLAIKHKSPKLVVCSDPTHRVVGGLYQVTSRGDRREAMARAFLSGAYTMQEIGEHFGVHYSTVSRAVHWFESQLQDFARLTPLAGVAQHHGASRARQSR